LGWWGKLVGGAFGYMLGGPLGAVLGAALGHRFDKGLRGLPGERVGWDPGDQERVQTAFFTTTFSVMGHLAKADGRVSPDEIRLAEAVMSQMSLSREMRQTAIRLFNEGKAADFPLDQVVEQFRIECRRRQTLIQMFMEIQIQAAFADGRMQRQEETVLRHIAQLLHISDFTFRLLVQRVEAEIHHGRAGGRREAARAPAFSLDDAYAILNVKPDAGDREVKRAYRRLISQHHPDKLVSKGLPEEMMKLAAQKTDEIKKAYERIKEARGMA
jgi:DnaJ like chaperone protein